MEHIQSAGEIIQINIILLGCICYFMHTLSKKTVDLDGHSFFVSFLEVKCDIAGSRVRVELSNPVTVGSGIVSGGLALRLGGNQQNKG